MGSKTRMRILVPILLFLLSDVSLAELPAPEITVSRSAEELIVSWTEVDESIVENCFLVYAFTHQINGVNISHHVTLDTHISVPFEPCVDNHFILRPRCVTGAVVGSSATKDYFTGITANLKIETVSLQFEENNNILASWTRPADSQACSILYRVQASVGGKSFEYTTPDTSFSLSPVPPCETLEVIVTPLDLEVIGQSNTASITAAAGNDVGTIKSVTINNGRIEWAGGDGVCEVSYTVTVRDNYGGKKVRTTTDRFLDAEFVYCAMYNILISSSFEGAQVVTAHANHRPRPAEVGEVEDLAVTEDDDSIEVSWSPVVFGVCKTHYKFRHYINGILVGAGLTTEANRAFGTNYCADNRVTVQPIVDMIMGPELATNHIASSREPEPIRNLRVTKLDGALAASWDAVSVGFCSIEYIVEHLVGDNEIQISTVTTNSISLQRHSCSNNTIRVTPVAGTYQGPSKSEQIKVGLESLNPVDGLYVKEVRDGLYVSWNPIEKGFCDIAYTITNYDGENINTYQTNRTSYTIQRTNCAKNTVSVKAVEPNTQVTSSPSYRAINVDIDLSKVRNLSVNRRNKRTLEIDWQRPADSKNCDISFIVRVVVGNETVLTKQTTKTELFVNVDIKPCEIFDVILTPVSPAGAKGEVAKRRDTARLFGLNSPSNLRKEQGRLTWYKPQDIGLCEIHFKVNVTNEFGTLVNETRTQATELELQMTPCRQYTARVRAIDVLTGIESKDSKLEKVGVAKFLTQISALENFLDAEYLRVSWNPVDAGDCSVLYEVSQLIDEEYKLLFVTSETTTTLNVAACTSNEITVTPVLDEGSLIGDSFTQTVLVDLDVLNQVGDIIVLASGILWSPPPLSGRCHINYTVEIFDANHLLAEFVTSDLLIEWPFVSCAQYTVRITPSHFERRGPYAEVVFIAQDADHAPPVPANITTSLTSANITFEANSWTVNSCPIEEVKIICSDDSGVTLNRTIAVADNADRVFEVSLTNLKPNTHFSCVAQWLPHTSAPSKTFEFITRYIPVTNFQVSNVTSNDFTITWEDPQGLGRYIKYFIVVIESQGPNHFVQKSCDIDRYRTYSYNVALGKQRFTFSNARANFKYHVSLITRFTIGVDTKADFFVVNTLPGVPGPITDIVPKFNLEKCAKYSGDGAFIWTPPCDINGDLYKFEATLTTSYTVGDENRTHTAQMTLRPKNLNNEDYTFSAQIPTLNPFFTYSISVDVFAAYPSKTPSKLTGVVPPTAYTYCSRW